MHERGVSNFQPCTVQPRAAGNFVGMCYAYALPVVICPALCAVAEAAGLTDVRYYRLVSLRTGITPFFMLLHSCYSGPMQLTNSCRPIPTGCPITIEHVAHTC